MGQQTGEPYSRGPRFPPAWIQGLSYGDEREGVMGVDSSGSGSVPVELDSATPWCRARVSVGDVGAKGAGTAV